MIPLPNARAVLLSIAIVITTYSAFEAGRASHAELALGALRREAHYRRLYVEVVEQTDKAMSRLLASDYYLHDTITAALPHWHETRMVARAILAGEG